MGREIRIETTDGVSLASWRELGPCGYHEFSYLIGPRDHVTFFNLPAHVYSLSMLYARVDWVAVGISWILIVLRFGLARDLTMGRISIPSPAVIDALFFREQIGKM